jgi:hypothetical protein
MKTLKTFLSVIFLGLLTTITAQIPNGFSYQAAIRGNDFEEKEWFPIGAEWFYEDGNDMALIHRHFFVEKDTVVNEKNCKIISGDENKEIVYEENECVYYLFNNKFRKIYDFNVQQGDIVEFEFKTSFNYLNNPQMDSTLIIPCAIKKVMTKNVNGVELKEIHAYVDNYYGPGNDWDIPLSERHIYSELIGSEFPGMLGVEFISKYWFYL